MAIAGNQRNFRTHEQKPKKRKVKKNHMKTRAKQLVLSMFLTAIFSALLAIGLILFYPVKNIAGENDKCTDAPLSQKEGGR